MLIHLDNDEYINSLFDQYSFDEALGYALDHLYYTYGYFMTPEEIELYFYECEHTVEDIIMEGNDITSCDHCIDAAVYNIAFNLGLVEAVEMELIDEEEAIYYLIDNLDYLYGFNFTVDEAEYYG